jgi:chemotaxis protein methyltransferase CheR
MSAEALALLSDASGLELEAYRAAHVERSVRRALAREPIGDESGLAALLRSDPAARSRFRRSVAVSVSRLFRDPAQFELLEHELLPRLLAGGRTLAAWSAGCADGSELVSLALLLDRLDALERSSLLGSDVLPENLELARRRSSDAAIPERLLRRLRWEQRDLIREQAPPGEWTLVLCRNLAIYLGYETKAELHAKLAGALAPGGILLLGRSERLSEPKTLGLKRIAPHAYLKVSP